MALVRRWDIVELRKPQQMANGWLRVDAYIAKTGVQEYRDSNGGKRAEYRDDSEVFHPDALASFGMVPVTNDHPPTGMLDAGNTRQYAVGAAGENVVRDGKHVRASLLIHDAQTVADVLAGKNQVSCGYVADVEECAGTAPDGTPYTHVQKAIRGNHVAIVRQGRAGPSVRVRVDSTDAAMVGFETTDAPDSRKLGPDSQDSRDLRTMKIRIDGVEVEVSDAAAQLIEKERVAALDSAKVAKAEVEKLTAEVQKATGRADGLDVELTSVKKELAEAPEKARAALVARAALEAAVKKIAPALKTDGLSDADVRRKAVLEAEPDAKLEGKSDAHVEGRFEQLTERADKEPGVFARRDVAATATLDSVQPDPAAAMNKLLAAYGATLAK